MRMRAGLDVPTPPPAEVARYTVRTMLRSIPPAVPGIHFLSGALHSLVEILAVTAAALETGTGVKYSLYCLLYALLHSLYAAALETRQPEQASQQQTMQAEMHGMVTRLCWAQGACLRRSRRSTSR
jgi:fructose-bisphosphate aldolase class 1